jgi:hypothetical protein
VISMLTFPVAIGKKFHHCYGHRPSLWSAWSMANSCCLAVSEAALYNSRR